LRDFHSSGIIELGDQMKSLVWDGKKGTDQATGACRREGDRMQNEPKKEYASTYYVQDRHSEQELVRLRIQGQMMTEAMGGPLPEQADPRSLLRVLDITCGPGEWVIETAKTYPTMSLTDIDISRSMIQYAREQAVTQHLEDRVSFHVMDALLLLEFPSSFFDLVNLRCCVGFMRTWDWPTTRICSVPSRHCAPSS